VSPFRRTFRTLRKFLAPRWVTDDEGELVGYALDLQKDSFAERAFLGLLAGYPQNGPNGETAPPDALVRMGRDRRVVRGIFETDAQYAVRLKSWLDERRTTGNPFTLMRQLAAYTGDAHGVSFRTVDATGNWYSRSSTGVESALLKQGNWDWDGRPLDEDGRTRWARFWVIIYPGTLWGPSPWDWGDATGPDWGEFTTAHTLGSTATMEHVATLRAIVSDWMGAGKRCVNIILAFDPASFDPAAPEPDGLWEHWSKVVANVRVPARLATARYLDGVRS
jgi:hypothetical protein